MTVSQSDEVATSTHAGVLPPSVKGVPIRRIHEYSPAFPGRGNPVASTHLLTGMAILGGRRGIVSRPQLALKREMRWASGKRFRPGSPST